MEAKIKQYMHTPGSIMDFGEINYLVPLYLMECLVKILLLKA